MDKRLLQAINDADLTWADLDGATLKLIDETIKGDKIYVDLGVNVGNEEYLWTIIGDVKNGKRRNKM